MLYQVILVKKYVINQTFITHNNNNNVQIYAIIKIISIKLQIMVNNVLQHAAIIMYKNLNHYTNV